MKATFHKINVQIGFIPQSPRPVCNALSPIRVLSVVRVWEDMSGIHYVNSIDVSNDVGS